MKKQFEVALPKRGFCVINMVRKHVAFRHLSYTYHIIIYLYIIKSDLHTAGGVKLPTLEDHGVWWYLRFSWNRHQIKALRKHCMDSFASQWLKWITYVEMHPKPADTAAFGTGVRHLWRKGMPPVILAKFSKQLKTPVLVRSYQTTVKHFHWRYIQSAAVTLNIVKPRQIKSSFFIFKNPVSLQLVWLSVINF